MHLQNDELWVTDIAGPAGMINNGSETVVRASQYDYYNESNTGDIVFVFD